MNRTLASLLKEIAQILTDEKDEISGVFFCAVKRDGSAPEIVAQLDDRAYWDANTGMTYWRISQGESDSRLTLKALWRSREDMQMNNERERLEFEMAHPHRCDALRYGRLPCGARFKTARGLETHKKRGYGHRKVTK